MLTDEEIRELYGSTAIVSRTRGFALIHLDAPSMETVRRRTEEFDPDESFESDCPLCTIQRGRAVFVYDDYPDSDEDIVVE